MTYESFENYKKQNNCYEICEYYSDNERNRKFLENIRRAAFFKNENLLLTYIQRYRPFCSFIKREMQSGDFVEYHIGLDDSMTLFSDEFNTAMIKIGCCRNSSCGYKISNSQIELFFLSENEQFYAKKISDNKLRLIAENEENFFDYIVSTEYDYHAKIEDDTYKVMQKSGWYAGRKLDISKLIKLCFDNGVRLSEKQIAFLQEFGGMIFETNEMTIEIGLNRKEKGFIEYYSPVKKYDPSDSETDTFEGRYMLYHNVDIVCVGSTYHPSEDEYNALWLTSDGELVWDVAGRRLGRNAMEGFNILICG